MESSPPAQSVSISDSNDNASTSASEFEYCSSNTDQTSVDDTIPSEKPKLQPASNLEAVSVTPTAAYTQFDPPLFTDEIGPTDHLAPTATAVDYFQLFYTDEMISHICQQTNLYSTQSSTSKS